MYYHEPSRLIFLAHPRTASVATAWELTRLGFTKVMPGDHHLRLWGRSPAKPFTRETRGEWSVFTTVRNHWDAAVSWRFKNRHVRSDSSAWDARSWELLFQGNLWVKGDRMWGLHSDDADIILRYETLEENLKALLASRGILLENLSEQNTTPCRNGRPYRPFFTEDGRQYIAERFHDEIARFGYEF